jgi:gas vesicle protein GvpL/GvpF
MTLIAHAIAPAPRGSLDGEGLRGRPLSWSGAGDIGLWSTHWDPADKLDRGDALEHHRLVERICASQPCLPVRFGTAFPTEDAARASLASRSAELRAALDRVAGKSELAVTLLWRESATPAPGASASAGPGRRFMDERRAFYAARKHRQARAAELAEGLLAKLAIERALVWYQTTTSEGVAVSLAVLVPSDQAKGWKADLERLAGGYDDVVGVVNGPWPPYSFASVEQSGGSAPRPPTGSAARPPS